MEIASFNCPECGKKLLSLEALRKHRSMSHKISSEQTYVEIILNGVEPKCACGCGENVNFLSFQKGFTDYVLGHASRVNNNWGHNSEAIRKSHETQKKMYESGELQIWNKGLDMTDERVRNNIEKVLANPNRGVNISKKLTGIKKSESHIKKIKESAQIRWANLAERELQSHRRMLYISKNGFITKSKLEDTFMDILFTNFNMIKDEDYIYQYYIRDIKSIYDFKIKGKNILIEVDGDFWHCNPNSKFKTPSYAAQKQNLIQDEIKNKWCDDNNYKLLRFWESDINNNPEMIISILKEELGLS